jgi:hypothetical protein
MRSLFQLFRKPKQDDAVVIVSGLPRSGTSMMMKMLEAGGLPPMTDNIRTADADNPKGYYEFERVKKLPDGDKEWVGEAHGKAVKVITALLEHLPPGHTYKVIFMRRSLDEILASQKKMLIRSGKPTDKVSDEELGIMYRKHLAKVESWLAGQPNIFVLDVDYNEMIRDPLPQIEKVRDFIGNGMDTEKMAAVVDPDLYRQRKKEISGG